MPTSAETRPAVLTSATQDGATSWRLSGARVDRERARLTALGLPAAVVETLVEELPASPDVDPQTIGRSPEGRRAFAYWRTLRNARDRQRTAARCA